MCTLDQKIDRTKNHIKNKIATNKKIGFRQEAIRMVNINYENTIQRNSVQQLLGEGVIELTDTPNVCVVTQKYYDSL